MRCFETVSRPRVYLDKVRLLDGQRFDIGFTVGLAQSTVSQTLLAPSPSPFSLPLPPSLRPSPFSLPFARLCTYASVVFCVAMRVLSALWLMALSPCAYATDCAC